MIASIMSLLIVAQVGIMSPGPDAIMVIKSSIHRPMRAAIMTALGISCGVVIHLSLCVAGVSAIIVSYPKLFSLLQIVGAIYLFYLGVKSLTSKAVSAHCCDGLSKIDTKDAFWEGFLCNLTNPKVSLFFLGIFSQFIPQYSTIETRALYGAILAIHAAIYWTLLVVLIQSFRVDALLARWGQLIDRVFGGLLILVSLWIVI